MTSFDSPLLLPPNARIGARVRIAANPLNARGVFLRFRSRRDPGLVVGEDSVLEDVTFNVGPDGLVEIGQRCRIVDAYLLSDVHLRIGNGVVLGWHAMLVDSDFHPIDLEQRIVDARAISPAGRDRGAERPPFVSRAVVLEDEVWVGPNAMILKGVTVGRGAIIEAGAVVTRDVAAGARVIGNPAQPVRVD